MYIKEQNFQIYIFSENICLPLHKQAVAEDSLFCAFEQLLHLVSLTAKCIICM